ncbi:MAG: UDP-N-acetylmuramate dehydrogenase [Pseudomonadales bacterium]
MRTDMSTGPKTDLTRLNTLAVGSEAAVVHTIGSVDDFGAVADSARQGPVVVLGGGSNVVLGAHIDCPVFLIRNRGIGAERRNGLVEVTAAAGENWHGLVRWCLGRGLSGLENLALIPGSVGAAPVQNIGAYGVELDTRLLGLQALEVGSGRLRRMSPAECQFGYRTSLFKTEPGRFVIAEVTLALDPVPVSVITSYPDVAEELERMGRVNVRPVDVAEAVIRIRRRKLPDPRRIPNAGSFFKNPVVDEETAARLSAKIADLKTYPAPDGVKLAAAQLIDRCRHDETGELAPWANAEAAVRIWHRQPLVLTNPGRRPASEVLAVAATIRASVAARFGVRLELEPDTIGC